MAGPIADFLKNPQVHEAILGTTAFTALVAALPRPWSKKVFRVVQGSNRFLTVVYSIFATLWNLLGLIYEFFYNFLVTFWSQKVGQDHVPPVPPAPPVANNPNPIQPPAGQSK